MGDIVDRMRANRAGLASYVVATGGTGTNNSCSEATGTATAAGLLSAHHASATENTRTKCRKNR